MFVFTLRHGYMDVISLFDKATEVVLETKKKISQFFYGGYLRVAMRFTYIHSLDQ